MFSLQHRCLILLFAASCVITLPQVANGQFGGLVGRVPSDANSLVILNVEKMKMSPIAKTQNWRANHEAASAAGITILPPSATHFLMAAKMDFEFMQPIWEVALSNITYQASMPKIAARWQGEVDRVAGRSAVRMPDDSYVVDLGPSIVGAMRPASRQSVTRWLEKTSRTGSGNLSPYMEEAKNYAVKQGTPIILALDLEHVVSESAIRGKADELKALDPSLDIEQAAKLLSSIRGVILGLNVTDKVGGAIIVDFSEDVTPLTAIAKPLLLNVLANNSAMIDEFNDWSVSVKGKRIRLSGQLYNSGVQRIFSILDVPGSLAEHRAMPSAEDGDDPEQMARLASQAYFKSVTGLIEDLQDKPNSTQVKTSGQVGLWFGRYAKKIDNLPILNVDDDLLEYGAFVADSMRDAEMSLRNVGGQKRVRQLNAPAQYRSVGRYGAYGSYGGYWESPRLESQNRARIATEERVKGARSTREIMQTVSSATADIRRAMTKKYNAEF